MIIGLVQDGYCVSCDSLVCFISRRQCIWCSKNESPHIFLRITSTSSIAHRYHTARLFLFGLYNVLMLHSCHFSVHMVIPTPTKTSKSCSFARCFAKVSNSSCEITQALLRHCFTIIYFSWPCSAGTSVNLHSMVPQESGYSALSDDAKLP